MNKKHFPDEIDEVSDNVTSTLGSRFARLADDEFFDRDYIRSRRGKFRRDVREYSEVKHSRKRNRERLH